jgi:hypothetical protein
MGAKIVSSLLIVSEWFGIYYHANNTQHESTHYWDGYTRCFITIMRVRYVTSYPNYAKIPFHVMELH